ncbi:MAG TPA: ATP-binding protein [Steroidobacteraceae bacterium]|nr:ATP-binding protein [Steroidobacteraceae bacterium]
MATEAGAGPATHRASGLNARSWLRSAAARLTLTYGVVVLLLVVGLQGTVWWLTRNALEREVQRVMTAELDKLAQVYVKNGSISDVAWALRERADSWGRTGAVYLLVNPAMARVEGNLIAWPLDVEPRHDTDVHFRIAAEGELGSHPVRAHLVMLAGGYWLLVGTDTSEMERALRRFGWASVWGVLAITLLIVALARWYAAQAARRVREFSNTCDAIVHSDLSRRLELRGKGDEFDQLGRTVNDMLERLEQQATLLRTTYGSIAHDLRTPLYRLRVRMEEALRRSDVPAASLEMAQPALEELDRVQRTLGTLLEIARAESSGPMADVERIDLAQLAREMHELYQPGMQDSGLDLQTDSQGEAVIHGKRQLLAQLIANLLENAIKYVPAGGTVHLGVSSDPHWLTLVVSDNGPGMSGEKPAGGGLGLNLVKAIARLHRGEVFLRNNQPGLAVECRFERRPNGT